MSLLQFKPENMMQAIEILHDMEPENLRSVAAAFHYLTTEKNLLHNTPKWKRVGKRIGRFTGKLDTNWN